MMKRLITKGILTVAAVLFTMSALAAGKVEVVGDTSHGTVTSEANGAVVTLTVTPAEGYYIRKSDITVTKTFMPVFEAASRRANVPVSDMLTLAGADPEDLSAPRTYTVTMPGEEYDLMVDVRYTSRQGITEAMVSLSETVFVYNEQIQRPTVSVQGLREGTDYTVTYSNAASQEPDTYSVTVKGISAWHGTITRTYKIFMGGKAEVNTKIAGGAIATSIDGLTMTMTVTPAKGYYIRKEDVVVAKTYLPVAAAPARRSIPVADQLAIEGDDPENLSLARTYTVQLPGWEFSAYVDAVFTERQTVTDRMVTLSATSFIYNGNDQKPEVTVDGLTEGKDYLLDFEGTSWSDVATYTLTVTGRSTWKGVVSKTYTIVKAPAVVTQAPEALTLTYNGEEQQLLSAGDAIGGILMYSTDGTDYQTAIPTAIAAGSYTLYYMVVGDANHSDSQPVAVTVAVAQKDITVSGIAAQDKVYDGTTAATLIFDAVAFDGLLEGDTLSVTAEGSFADKNVGADKVVTIRELTLGGESIANYLLAAAGQQSEATASIGKKDITISGIVAQDKDYDGTIDATLDYDAVVYDGIVEGDMLSVVAEGSFADANVGADKEVTISGLALDGESMANYQLAVTGQQTVTTASIGQVPSVLTKAPEALTLTYNGAAQLLLTAGEATGGVMAYSADGTDFQTEIPTATDAGSYTLYYKVVGDANHSDSQPVAVTVAVAQKDITVSGIAAQDKVYDGTTVATLIFDAVAFDGLLEGDTLSVTAEGSFADKNVGADKVVNIRELTLGGESIANYLLAAAGQQSEATASIGKKDITISGIVAQDKDYDGTIEATLDYDAVVYDGIVEGDMLSVVAEGSFADANVGADKEVTISGLALDGESIANYQLAVTGQQTVTTASIGQVPSVMTKAPEALTLTYNGAAQLLLTAGEAAGGAMAYSTDRTDFQTEIPTATDAGTYTLYYKVVGDDNHSDTEVFTVEASIVAKVIDTPVITLEEAEYVYDGKAKEPLVVSVKAGDAVIPATEYAVSYHQNVNAGQAEVIVSDLEGGNYTVAGSVTFTIGKALLTVTAKDKRMFVNEKVPELTLAYEGFANKENEDDLTVVPMATTTATPESEPDVYDIVVSGGEAVNYDFAYVSGQLTVLVPEFVSEEGLGVEAEVVTDGETGETIAVITELPNSFWEGTGDIPTTLTDGEGNEYEVTQVDAAAFDAMESDIIVVLPEGLTTTEAVTNVVNGDGSCETLDLTDISNLNLPIDVEAETVVYTREVEADEELITVCLPYELHVPDNTTAYTLNDADEGGITLEEHKGDMEAFQPYVLSINTPSQARRRNSGTAPVTVDLGATNVSIASTKEEGATKMNGFVLRGSLRSMTHQEGYAMRAYSMQPDGSWAMTASAEPKMADKQYLGAFQAYLIYEGDDEPESISTTLRETSLTSIPLTNVSTANDDNGWYDLMGRKLTGKQPRKGIYLHHGKRIVNWR